MGQGELSLLGSELSKVVLRFYRVKLIPLVGKLVISKHFLFTSVNFGKNWQNKYKSVKIGKIANY